MKHFNMGFIQRPSPFMYRGGVHLHRNFDLLKQNTPSEFNYTMFKVLHTY